MTYYCIRRGWRDIVQDTVCVYAQNGLGNTAIDQL